MLRLPGLLAQNRFGGSLLHRTHRTLGRELKSIRTGEVALTSFAFGLIQGKYKKDGGLTLLLPVDLLTGIVAHGAALFTDQYASHLHAIGDGALASFFTTTGYRVGERWQAGGSIWHSLGGMFGDTKEPAGGSTIADKELASLVRAG